MSPKELTLGAWGLYGGEAPLGIPRLRDRARWTSGLLGGLGPVTCGVPPNMEPTQLLEGFQAP